MHGPESHWQWALRLATLVAFRLKTYPVNAQNSLPSGSANTDHSILSSGGLNNTAPEATRPLTVVSTSVTSQCTRFFTIFGSGTCWKTQNMNGNPAAFSIHTYGDPSLRSMVPPVRSAHHPAIASGSTASTTSSNGPSAVGAAGCGPKTQTGTPSGSSTIVHWMSSSLRRSSVPPASSRGAGSPSTTRMSMCTRLLTPIGSGTGLIHTLRLFGPPGGGVRWKLPSGSATAA